MEATESPLDVLSRAATMVQDSSPPEYECATRPCAAKELPSSRWRRERREKVSGGFGKLRASHPPAAPTSSPAPGSSGLDAPLDMTTPRGLPPSYSRSARHAPRVSVITRAADATPRNVVGGSAGQRREQLCDPVIDEHFRRSLGNKYSSLFDDSARQASRVTVTGLSVDDHFAKALGDTWTKLQQAEPEPPSAPATPPSPGSSPSEATPAPAAANPGAAKLLSANQGVATLGSANQATAKLVPARRGLVTI